MAAGLAKWLNLNEGLMRYLVDNDAKTVILGRKVRENERGNTLLRVDFTCVETIGHNKTEE
jgi:hypothetical protein